MKTIAKDVGTTYPVSQAEIDEVHADCPLGEICELCPCHGEETDDERLVEAAKRLVLRVALPGDENDGVKFDGEHIVVAISDGSKTWYEEPVYLYRLPAIPALASRLFSHVTTSSSPHCEAASPERWGWLTPAGLGAADRREVSVPRSAVPHIVGRRGQTVRTAEDALGVLIGIIDGKDDQATVTLIGPLAQVEFAKEVVSALAVGARSVLSRLIKPG